MKYSWKILIKKLAKVKKDKNKKELGWNLIEKKPEEDEIAKIKNLILNNK
jgi:hypothetical protein